MSRHLQMIIGLAAFAFGICSILCFFDWLGDTDWLMGHTYGSAASIIAAFWTATFGVICTVICLALALSTKSADYGELRKNQNRWLIRQCYALGLLLIPVVFVAAVSFFELPRARQVLQAKRIRSGEASVAEMIVVLETPRPNLEFAGVHNAAIEELGKRGPKSKDAVPVLARLLKDPASTWMAAKSLAAIGPDAKQAIPALADVIKREQGKGSGVGGDGPSTTSSLAGEALTKIGETSVPELTRLLAHDDRFVRICAARSLGNMGSKSKDAIPALYEASKDEDETVSRYARRALDGLEPQHAEIERGHIVPKENDTTPTTLSSSWTTQPPYAGDPHNRPRGTVFLRFADGYVLLITGRVERWEQSVDGEKRIHAAITANHRYEHVIGTHEVRMINLSDTHTEDDGPSKAREHKTTDDSND